MILNLILTSDFPVTKNDEIISILKSHHKNPNIAWVPPAAEDADIHFPLAQEQFKKYGFTNLTIFPATTARCNNELEEFDVVYFTGGDPIKFRQSIVQSNISDSLKAFINKDKIIIAASGGSMQFTMNVSLFRLATAEVNKVLNEWNRFIGLNIVDYELLPHLNKFDSSFLNKVRLYSERQTHDILALSDGSAIIHTSQSIYRFTGKALRYYKGEVIEVNEIG